jgi:hypothetical protein
MKRREEVLASFQRTTASHTMKIHLDSGLYRHVEFSRAGSMDHRFDLHTWPGYLCITGDCGSFVFTRLSDMFSFFRGDPEGDLKINEGYWAEKLEAVDKCDGYKEYARELFEEAIKDIVADWDYPSEEARAEEWEEILDEVLGRGENGYTAMEAATEFKSEHQYHDFADFWETTLDQPTYRYLWCLYAIVWGIRMYDAAKAAAAQEVSA